MTDEKIIAKCSLQEDGFYEWCSGMNYVLHPSANEWTKGLVQVNLFNLKTGKESCLGVVYRTSAKKDCKKLMLNVCPFCGEKILNKSKMKDKE